MQRNRILMRNLCSFLWLEFHLWGRIVNLIEINKLSGKRQGDRIHSLPVFNGN